MTTRPRDADVGGTGGRDQAGRLPALPAATPRTVDHSDEVIAKLEDEIAWLRATVDRLLTSLEVSRAATPDQHRGERAVRTGKRLTENQDQ